MDEDKEKLDQALPWADDVISTVGVGVLGETRIAMAQMVLAQEEQFKGFPKTLFVKRAQMFGGGGEQDLLLFYDQPKNIPFPLLAVTWDGDLGCAQFMETYLASGLFLFDVITPTKHHRALSYMRSNSCEVVFSRDITPEFYRQMVTGGNVRPIKDYDQQNDRPSGSSA